MRNVRCNPAEFIKAQFMARGPSGPWGRHGRGHGHGPDHGHEGRGSPRGLGADDFSAKRMLGHGDLRFVILSLLETNPSHGYELIKAIEDKSAGHYVPSPGVIYPTLTFLQEGGFATVSSEAGKNLYTITDEGRAMLDENRSIVQTIFERMTMIGERMSRMKEWIGREDMQGDPRKGRGRGPGRDDHSEVIHAAFHTLKKALFVQMPVSLDDQKAIAAIIEKAAAEIEQLHKKA